MPPTATHIAWYHCISVSIAIHMLLFALAWFCIPEHIEVDYAANAALYDSLVHITIELPTVSESMPSVSPEPVSPEEDPFEPDIQTASVEPNIIWTEPSPPPTPAPAESSSDPDPAVPPSDTVSTPEPSSETGTIPTSDSFARPEDDAGSANHQAAVNTVFGTNVAKSGSEAINPQPNEAIPQPPQPDMKQIWADYTRTLSDYFKSKQHYPEMARRLKLTGTVWILLELRRNGTLISAQIAQSSGVPILDEAAIEAATQATPVPPFPAQTTDLTKKIKIPYRYKLK